MQKLWLLKKACSIRLDIAMGQSWDWLDRGAGASMLEKFMEMIHPELLKLLGNGGKLVVQFDHYDESLKAIAASWVNCLEKEAKVVCRTVRP